MSDQHHEKKGYYTGDIHNEFIEEHHDPSAKKRIWKTFWILLTVTLFEVGIAFTSIPHNILLIIFITLTLVKAGYIVYIFMHLMHEKKIFQMAILVPFVLIIYLIAISLYEGSVLDVFWLTY
ncbi:MAG TPA: cytochrome C oxidase subunit IV family protein [Bacteroidia bacterium]|nr:cytochrome C oxidase subunit IV family protein [Bacteroidia bacterium]HNT81114.1 cytochrome C oxidase subunit IV family protein [Bacteroidia bacterium]